MPATTIPKAAAPGGRHTALPGWLRSRNIVVAGLLLALSAVALALAFLWYERREVEERTLHATGLMARVLEDHANRSFASVDAAMTAAMETLNQHPDTTLAGLGAQMAATSRGLPFLRSLSVVDGAGRVLASSNPANVGASVDMAALQTPAAGGGDRVGTLLHGRDLRDAMPRPAAGDGAAQGGHLLPLARGGTDAQGRKVLLVAALDPAFFAAEYRQTMAADRMSGALVALDGTVLAASGEIGLQPGTRTANHPFLAAAPAVDHLDFIGAGLDGDRVVSAAHILPRHPLAVIVEQPEQQLMAELSRVAAWVALALAGALSIVAALAGLAWRSMRSREAVNAALDATRVEVENRERDLRMLVESVHELIFRTDEFGVITYVNGRWQELSGRSDAAAIGRRFSELCVREDRETIEAIFDPTAYTGRIAATVRLSTPEGQVRTLEISVAAVRDEHETLLAFGGFAVDVSDRELARRQLEEQLDFTARLLEVSPTALFAKDEQGRFVTVNAAWLDLMAMNLERVIGHDSHDLFGGDGPRHAAHDDELMIGGGRLRYENRLKRLDGEVRDTIVTKVRFTRADGTPAGIVGSIIDITEFREAERTTREARDAAERANAAKSEFIANMSHELRTPLQSIIGFSEIGADRAQGDMKEMFGEIHAGGQRMLRLVNGQLDLSKMESTIGSLALERNDVAVLAAQVVRELRPIADQRRLRIVLEETEQPVMVDVDAFRLQQVIRNVLANAMRFSPPDSSIDVAFRDLGSDGVQLTVRDHGPGVPPEELESIFDAFVQSTRTKDGSGGTGLGLTICRKIMSAHGGSISAANAPDGGALMVIHLPAPQPVDTPMTTTEVDVALDLAEV